MRRVLIVLMFFLSIGTVYAQTGPVLDIRMDEGDGKTVTDASGNGNDGTHYGNTRLLMHFDGDANDSSSYGNDGTVNGATLTTGVWGNGLEFDGVDDYVDAGNDASLEITSQFSIGAWIKFSNLGDQFHTIIEKGRESSNLLYWVGYDHRGTSANWWIELGNGSTRAILGDSWTPSTDKWYHVVFTFSSGDGTLYINGSQFATKSYDFTTVNSSTFNMLIGSYKGNSYFFNGTIDEVAIYSKALSASEISDLYNAKKAKFTDWTDGKVGNALEFDGVDDYVDVGDSSSLSANNRTTVSFWMKAGKNSFGYGYGHIMGKSGGGNHEWAFRFLNNSDNDEYVNIYFMTWSLSGAPESQSSSGRTGDTIPINEWIFVTGVLDETNVSIYINGELNNTQTRSPTLNIGNGSANVQLGAREADPSDRVFNGTIDEVRIWNRALTEDEIYWQYHWNEYYPWQVTVPPTATQVSGSILWTGIDQKSDVELSFVSPGGAEYTRDSEGAKENTKFLRSITITLPVVDYNVTVYNGYKRLKVPSTESGKWEFRVRSRDVTDMEAEVGWK